MNVGMKNINIFVSPEAGKKFQFSQHTHPPQFKRKEKILKAATTATTNHPHAHNPLLRSPSPSTHNPPRSRKNTRSTHYSLCLSIPKQPPPLLHTPPLQSLVPIFHTAEKADARLQNDERAPPRGTLTRMRGLAQIIRLRRKYLIYTEHCVSRRTASSGNYGLRGGPRARAGGLMSLLGCARIMLSGRKVGFFSKKNRGMMNAEMRKDNGALRVWCLR